MVAVRVADACLTDLDHELIALRKQFRFHERHAFRHASCTAVLRENFLECVCRIEFAAWARIIAKSTEWRDRFRPSEPGDQRLVQALIDVLVCIPANEHEPASLLLDIPKTENHRVRRWAQEIRERNRQSGYPHFKRVKSQTDTDDGGGIIQIADMVAGSLNSEMRGDLVLPRGVRSRIQVV